MSSRRHRQTPLPKHDEKTRHMGLAHVAQLRISLWFYFGEVFSIATIRCYVRYPFRHLRGYGGHARLLLGVPSSPAYRSNGLTGVIGLGPAQRLKAAAAQVSARWWAIAAPTEIKEHPKSILSPNYGKTILPYSPAISKREK